MAAIAFGLPRSTTRIGYASIRDHKRNCELSREERGLPLHPANGFIYCPSCQGAGEHVRNDSGCGDPQSDYGLACGNCDATGEVQDGHIDPLVLMAKYRAGRFTWAMSERRKADRRHYYRLYRARSMRPCSGLLATEMLARSQILANNVSGALQQVAA